jgi:FMN-dependent NADH-azoreductase
MSTLFVTSSHNESSQSKKFGEMIVARLNAESVTHDTTQIPHLYAAECEKSLVKDILECDNIVIATPMWNYGMPSSLKAWVDHVTVSGKTFQYDADLHKVVGRVKAKHAYIVVTCGTGVEEKSDRDFISKYLQFILSYIGMSPEAISVVWVNHVYQDDATERASIAIEKIFSTQ